MDSQFHSALAAIVPEVSALRCDLAANDQRPWKQIRSLQSIVDTLTADESADQGMIDSLNQRIAALSAPAQALSFAPEGTNGCARFGPPKHVASHTPDAPASGFR